MSEKEEGLIELTPINIIRSETVLSRYPIHRIAKKGTPDIQIRRSNEIGDITFRWEISHNSRYGQPGPLAYKLDTVVINRRIEAAGRPVPSLICLGSLNDISVQLGKAETRDTDTIKRALHQNAATYIAAKLTYNGKDGKQRKFEFGGTRYNVVFTGEKLPDGSRADAVYLVLHNMFRDLLNAAVTRPLDYDYLRDLPPGAQRFYELLSYQVYAALENNRPRAKYRYSEYCTYAPQTRHFEYDKVKKQMFKIHAPHRKAGYISKAEFEPTQDGEGQPDWLMYITPGPKAKAEHALTTQKNGGAVNPAPKIELLQPLAEEMAGKGKKASASLSEEAEALVQQLMGYRIARSTAVKLVKKFKDSVITQLEAFPFRTGVNEPAAYLVIAIQENYPLPESYAKAKAKKEGEVKAQARKAEEEAKDAYRERHKEAFYGYLMSALDELERTHEEAYSAFLDQMKGMDIVLRTLQPESQEMLRLSAFERFARENPGLNIFPFEEWDIRLNPKRSKTSRK